MCRVSNFIFWFLNAIIMISGLASIGVSCYLRVHGGGTECQKFIQDPLLIFGIFLFVVSLVGFIGSCCDMTFMLWIYSLVTFLLIVGLMVFAIFVFVVTNKEAGKVFSGLSFKEYRLGNYSNWLKKHFVTRQNWEEIRSCLVDAKVCDSLGSISGIADLYKKKMSRLQSGCCKPPTYCGFEYKNATFWEKPASGPAVPDPDCNTWSNDQTQLCFECNSCKGGVLDNIQRSWRVLGIINICVIIFIMIVYCTSCSTRRNIKYSQTKYYRGYYYPA